MTHGKRLQIARIQQIISENGIPVLCLFTDDILTAQRIFDALNRTSNLPTEKDIDDAITFLCSGKLKCT